MKFYLFEIKYWLRQPMVYIFFLINALMIFGATYSENITVGGSFGNIMKNAPFVIQTYYSIMSFITLLMTTSFVLASTTRDFSYNTYQIIFTTPVKRMEYLLGRFFGAVTISVIPLLGVSMGIIIGCMMPGMDPDKIGPFYFQAHLAGFLQLAVPNTLFSASVVFMIAALTRNTLAAFAGSLVLLLATGIADAFAEDLDKEWLAILLDPYGSTTFSILTKYWTVSQKNTMILGLEGWLLINRLIWLAISSILVLVTVKIFSFTEKSRSAKKSKNILSDEVVRLTVKPLPRVNPSYSSKASRIMFATRLKYELKGILKSPTFLIIMIAGLLNFIPNLASNTGSYGLTAHPVTHNMIENVQGAFYAFLIAIIIIYSGLLVWKERENKIDEIYDATPHPTHISYLSKFTSLAVIIFIVQSVCILTCILVQFAKGFTDIRPEVYIVNLLIIDYSKLLMLVVISMLMHALINNKYLAYFAFIIFLLLNTFVWRMLEIESHMVKFSGAPNFIYSDMNGLGPYVAGLTWFRIYWALFCILIIFVTIYAWTRGRETSFRTKMQSVLTGFKGARKPVILSILTLWLVTAGFIYYNTQQLNTYQTEEEIESVNIKYEQNYKKYQTAIQPRATAFVYNIDLFPEDRRLEIKGKYWAKNKNNVPIDSLHLTTVPYFTTTISVPGATKILDDQELQYQILRFKKPLMPGDSILIQFESQYDAKGFENDVTFNSIVDNGSFFNNYDFCPIIGYQPRREIEDRDKRKKHGLPENARLPKLQQNCTEACMSNYITNNSDWVNVETYFSTSEHSAGFWKIREISLRYDFPASWLSATKVIKGASLSVQGRNLFIWTPKTNLYTDPEYSALGVDSNAIGFTSINLTPPARYVGGTISLTF
jgi:ABC-2 type transport system permease protein